jgi:putative transposase
MRRKRFTEEQIIGVLQEATAGVSVRELARKHGIAEATFHRWHAKFAGMQVNDAKRLKALEDENRLRIGLAPAERMRLRGYAGGGLLRSRRSFWRWRER